MTYPRVHPIVASLFRLPFARRAFAHVHSQGVIHHTYSTKAAFEAISAFVRPGGSLFVWVYAVGRLVGGAWPERQAHSRLLADFTSRRPTRSQSCSRNGQK